ncbi:MAG TPA: TolC family protein [Nannocystaceae bacterium]|nr:TolC family protein [Nannocystaceae bacterium]
MLVTVLALGVGLAGAPATAAPAPGPTPPPGPTPAPGTPVVPGDPPASLPTSPSPRAPESSSGPGKADPSIIGAADRAADDALAGAGADTRRSAFDVPIASRNDPYGPRPAGVAKLTLEQINRYALENPAVAAAQDQIASLEAKVRKAKFAWVPIIDASFTLSPGVSIACDDFVLDTVGADPVEFQYCRPGGNANLDVQTAAGYFRQLGRAGVRFEFKADTVIPVYTFGKIKNTRRIAEAALAVTKLQKVATQQETLLRVQQAHTTLLLARQSMTVLREANSIVEKARKRVLEDLGGDPDDFESDPGDGGDPLRDPDDAMKVDLAGFEVEELMREALKVESLALSALWALAGKAAPLGFDVAEQELTPVKLDGGLRPLVEYKEMAAESRPEARMASAAVQVRKAQERLARSNFLPDLGVVLSVGIARTNAADPQMSTLYYQDAYNYSRVTAALALRWRFDFHNDAFDLQGARADLRAAEHQRAAAVLLLGRDVEEAFGDLVDARATIDLRDRARKRSWQLVVSQEQKDTVKGGNAGELLRALEKWYRNRFAHVEAVAQHNLAAARLARAVGTPLWTPPTSTVDDVKPTTDRRRTPRRDSRRRAEPP